MTRTDRDNFFSGKQLIYMPDFALRIRTLNFPLITSSVSFDAILYHKTVDDVVIALIMKFYRHRSLRFQDIEVLV